jgi:hypothetical protein
MRSVVAAVVTAVVINGLVREPFADVAALVIAHVAQISDRHDSPPRHRSVLRCPNRVRTRTARQQTLSYSTSRA